MIKYKPLRRSWDDARAKILREGACRVCGSHENIQAAHTIGRKYQDVEIEGPRGGKVLLVKEDTIVPLCEPCHSAYDGRRLDLLPYLGLWEQLNAVEAAGGIVSAMKRLTGGNA